MLNEIWDKEEIPSEWKTGMLVTIPKKGNLSECKNWRGIVLLSVPSKILCRIILDRIQETVDKKLRKEQVALERINPAQIISLHSGLSLNNALNGRVPFT